MTSINNNNQGSLCKKLPSGLTIKGLFLGSILLTGILVPVQAQEVQEPKFTKPTWWFGAAAGANFNFYDGSTQQLNAEITSPVAFHKGNGIGLFLAPLIEYRKPESKWGFMLQTGYDSRRGTFDQQITPCNCPVDLTTKLSYITVEPSIRFAPWNSGFFLMAGPRLAFNVGNSFEYQLGTNPAITDQPENDPIKGDLDKAYKTVLNVQIGAGYDIPLNSQDNRTQMELSPFVSFQPYFGQDPRSIETWTMSTLRAGVALKFGRGKAVQAKTAPTASTPVSNNVASVNFSVNSPENIPTDRRVREIFPLRNYVFFDQGSTTIPARYILLREDEVKDFKEDQLEVLTPKTLSGRSEREMVVYYNILNILGDRMGKNPASTINLVGSSENGPAEGKEMADIIKNYLVTIFNINDSRIATEGRDKPKLPSEQPGGTKELELLREGDRRVSIESTSSNLLMEFQTGPDASLKPVEITRAQVAPVDSYLTFRAPNSKEAFNSWSLEIKGYGETQNFGPYTQEVVRIPGKAILGNRPKGTYNVTMIGNAKNGKTVKQQTSVDMVLWTPSEDEQGMRYSVIYEFNDSKVIDSYVKYLTEVVTPKIPKGGKVIIHGHSDTIGDKENNRKLSLARATNVKEIIEKSLADAGRKDVKFEVYGFGEDDKASPFGNKFPEERFYNRTVIIDIIPGK